MTGKASVYIDTDKSDGDGDTQTDDSSKSRKAKPAAKTQRGPKENKKEGEVGLADDDAEAKTVEPLDRAVFGKFIMYYEAGKSFGEIALMSEDAKRNATIIADTDTDLLIIDRALFNRCVKAKEEAAYRERVEFVQNHPLFTTWTAKFRRLLEMSLRKETYPYGSVMVRQGQPACGLIFILSGQVRVCMEPARHEDQFPALLRPPPDPLTSAGKKPAPRDRARTPKARTTREQIEVRRRQGYAAAERRLMGRSVDVCCVEANEIMGDFEMVLELDTNVSTVVSTAITEVFVLNAKNYERLVSRKHPHTVRLLLDKVCQKLAARMHTAKVSQLPLIPRLHVTATNMQRRLAGTDSSRGRFKGDKRERRSGKESEMTLVKMFLEGRVPLIKPYVSDSLFYRAASAAKMKTFMSNPYTKLRTLSMLQTYTVLRRKAPRSMQQLKGNVKAERELLGYSGLDDDEDDTQDQQAYVTSARSPRRPASAAPVHPSLYNRPKSAMDMRIVPCIESDVTPGLGLGAGGMTGGVSMAGEVEDVPDSLDHDTVSEIFTQMEAVQRDKMDSRLRVLCTNSARAELRTKLEREPSVVEGGPHGYEELYEDSFYDWETSEGNLRELEARIAAFCSPTPEEGVAGPSRPTSSRGWPHIAAMKRFEVEDANSIPLPGGTVFVHHRPCRFSPALQDNSNHNSSSSRVLTATPHSHIRRFMLQRDRTPNLPSAASEP
ncbi:hypothetical protein BaRGS_00018507 [Batillaria attramentaria]|uniref:Cyclic nucleotide-binding domain-containing protein n=1 Tax=Batillaria attramentaria TaxID=370345 RepID=A0ABD0KSQ1_9CAEN